MTARALAALLLPALIAAAPPRAPAADAAGNRLAAFAAVSPLHADGTRDPFVRHCTIDRTASRRWCARLREDEGGHWRLELIQGASPARSYEVAGPDDAESAFAIWPRLVVEAGGAVLVGVERTQATGYAGGGGSATRLVLVRAEPGGGALEQVLDVPLRAGKDIRSCFGPRDMRRRRGACSDQYAFAATLTLDPATRAGRPHFLFSARARTWPGRLSPESDSTTDPPLRQSDLRWAVDPACTYRRRIAFDAGAGEYLADRPLPDCGAYLDI